MLDSRTAAVCIIACVIVIIFCIHIYNISPCICICNISYVVFAGFLLDSRTAAGCSPIVAHRQWSSAPISSYQHYQDFDNDEIGDDNDDRNYNAQITITIDGDGDDQLEDDAQISSYLELQNYDW